MRNPSQSCWRIRGLVPALVAILGLGAAEHAGAQEHSADPTLGLSLPTVPLAGDHDATSVVANPGGMVFLGGRHLSMAFTGLDQEEVGTPGMGVGFYASQPFQLPFLPRMSVGLGVERLVPPDGISPDPGKPVRLAFSYAFQLTGGAGVGLTWNHYLDSDGGAVAGVDSIDFGYSTRIGGRWAFGAVVRSINTPEVGDRSIERRWGGELVWRPTGTDRLEIGTGVEVGEQSGDATPRLRLSSRLLSGVWLRSEVGVVPRRELIDPAGGGDDTTRIDDWRATVGFEVSFGGFGLALYGTGGRGVSGGTRMLGGSATMRYSQERLPSVIDQHDHIYRVSLEGTISDRMLLGYVARLRTIARDPTVKALVVELKAPIMGWASLQELRDCFQWMRRGGKRIYVYMTAASLEDYYLATAANKIYLDPAGGLVLKGLSSTLMFFGSLFEKLGVKAQFERIEDFKTAPEAYTRSEPSEENKAMRRWLLDGIYGRIVADVARDRKWSTDRVRRLLETGPYTAQEAGDLGLVDQVIEGRLLSSYVYKDLGRVLPMETARLEERGDRWERPMVAVIYIDGDIVDGKSRRVPIFGGSLVGGDTVAASIAWARSSPQVKAIVLRVDSPGGSALASELIAREVFLTRGVKPIIVSMGDIAASGGYFAAAGGDLIYAQPSTITGSIGIFVGKIDMSELFERVGLTWYTERRGERADMYSAYRPYSDEERKLIKEKLRYYYGRFVDAVAKGRGMTPEDVDKVARGRVWTGTQAMERGLVDRYGGMMDAVLEAKKRAGYAEDDLLSLVVLPQMRSSFLEQVVGIGSSEREQTGLTDLPIIGAAFALLPGSILAQPDVPQARLPFEIVFE